MVCAKTGGIFEVFIQAASSSVSSRKAVTPSMRALLRDTSAWSGWLLLGVSEPESVAAHSFRTAIIGLILAAIEGADAGRTVSLCLMHDSPESRVGDIPNVGRAYGPDRPLEDRELGPVRVAGWRKAGAQLRPLLHSKMVVCCVAHSWDNPIGVWTDYLDPVSVWMGSANWTTASAYHLESGLWTTDPALLEAAFDYITAVIKISEPADSQAVHPSPELVQAEWDDAAFAEVLAEMELDRLAEGLEING